LVNFLTVPLKILTFELGKKMNTKKVLIIILHAFVGWALCGATVGIGRAVTSMNTTLIIHAIAAPIIFAVISTIYFKKFAFTKPLVTAFIFVGFIVVMDAALVTPVFEKSYEMFRSLLGTWIPFILIFASTYLTGHFLQK